jgi:hypothetical protein
MCVEQEPSQTETTNIESGSGVTPVLADANGVPEPRLLPNEMPDTVQMDPLDIVPEYMIDEVDGQPTINKRGYAVIARQFDPLHLLQQYCSGLRTVFERRYRAIRPPQSSRATTWVQ